MPLDVMIASSEDQTWPDMHKGQMKLKIRVRRMKESRDIRGWSPGLLPLKEKAEVCMKSEWRKEGRGAWRACLV